MGGVKISRKKSLEKFKMETSLKYCSLNSDNKNNLKQISQAHSTSKINFFRSIIWETTEKTEIPSNSYTFYSHLVAIVHFFQTCSTSLLDVFGIERKVNETQILCQWTSEKSKNFNPEGTAIWPLISPQKMKNIRLNCSFGPPSFHYCEHVVKLTCWWTSHVQWQPYQFEARHICDLTGD